MTKLVDSLQMICCICVFTIDKFDFRLYLLLSILGNNRCSMLLFFNTEVIPSFTMSRINDCKYKIDEIRYVSIYSTFPSFFLPISCKNCNSLFH